MACSKVFAVSFVAVFAAPVAALAQAGPTPVASATPSPAASPTPSAADVLLQEQIERELGTAPARTPPEGAARGSSGSFLSNVYNPAISVNGLFLGRGTSEVHPEEGQTATGMGIQELEVQFLANVDPYFQANLVLASPEGEGIELEEGYLTPSWSRFGLGLRVGKIKAPFGRENTLHEHGLPFIDKSLVGGALFGEEGFTEPTVEASWLSPLPWYSLVTVSFMDGTNEVLFNSPRGDDFAGAGSLKNVFDISDDATLELGGSFAAGNDADGKLASVSGGHVVVKWKPSRAATTRSAVLSGEVLYAHRPFVEPAAGLDPVPQDVGGAYGYAQWQLFKRFFVAARFDYLGMPAFETGVTRRESGLLVFAPTEFSAVRLQGSAIQPPFGADPVYEGFLQLNFTLGAHPAHSY
jgi:hypothetical protein